MVVTESTPAHQSREKSQGLFTTNRFTETLSWCSALWRWETGTSRVMGLEAQDATPSTLEATVSLPGSYQFHLYIAAPD